MHLAGKTEQAKTNLAWLMINHSERTESRSSHQEVERKTNNAATKFIMKMNAIIHSELRKHGLQEKIPGNWIPLPGPLPCPAHPAAWHCSSLPQLGVSHGLGPPLHYLAQKSFGGKGGLWCRKGPAAIFETKRTELHFLWNYLNVCAVFRIQNPFWVG